MRTIAAIILLCLTLAAPAWAQVPPPGPLPPQSRPLRLFVDCQDADCDFDHIRTEIPFVDYMRDRKEADVHLLITSQHSGAGGDRYTLNFMGQGPFEGMTDILTYDTLQTDTEEMVRKGLARTIKIGLMRYVARTPQALDLQISHRPPAGQGPDRPQGPARPVDDPWNFWVFRARFSGSTEGEKRTKGLSADGSFTANRTTEAWKFNLSNSIEYDDEKYTYSDGRTFTSVTREWGSDGLLVKSLSDHWSAGVRASLTSTTYYNQDLVIKVMPAIEWNLFPYAESTRREFTFLYSVGFHRYNYIEETIYGKLSENLLYHSATVSLDSKQPWGTAQIDFAFSQFLSAPSKYRLTASGEIDIRVTKGLSLSFDGSASFIRDQIYLPKGDATPEEILSRQRQLATGYRYSFSAGISYTFGSIFNNIVNTRM